LSNGDNAIPHIVIAIRLSIQGFKKFAMLGYGYGLIPRIDIHEELKKGTLVQLYPDKVWKIPLYWHYWAVQSKFYQKFNAEIIKNIKSKLNLEQDI
jgi:LysR family transcriptional regulator (chromosome initiation inhibitor)